jgi:antitoxin CptB
LKTDNDVRRKRLLFRSWHRGTRELDLLLGGFAERYLSTLTTPQLEIYEQLLEFSDPDIYNWITEAEPVPMAAQSEILALLQNFKTTV